MPATDGHVLRRPHRTDGLITLHVGVLTKILALTTTECKARSRALSPMRSGRNNLRRGRAGPLSAPTRPAPAVPLNDHCPGHSERSCAHHASSRAARNKIRPAQALRRHFREITRPTRGFRRPIREKVRPTRALHRVIREKVRPAQALRRHFREITRPTRGFRRPIREKVRPTRALHRVIREIVRPTRALRRVIREKVRPARLKTAFFGHFGLAGRTFSRTGHSHVATLKPMTPLQPLTRASMKPPSPLLTPDQQPLKPTTPQQPKNAPKRQFHARKGDAGFNWPTSPARKGDAGFS